MPGLSLAPHIELLVRNQVCTRESPRTDLHIRCSSYRDKEKRRLLLEKIRGKAYEQESKEIEQDDQNKLLSYSLSKRNLYTD